MVPLSFSGHEFQIIDRTALFWPEQRAVLVADLHLEKASAYAAQGQMLPPYDSHETLLRLASVIRQCGAERLFCLGDNFHDSGGETRLEAAAAQLLSDLVQRVALVWITGNHDPDVTATWGGRSAPEVQLGGVMLRHQALEDGGLPDISGHFHPKVHICQSGRTIRRACFVRGRRHLILPAFGSLTGGMRADDPVVLAAAGTDATAIVAVPGRSLHFPMTPKVGENTGQLALAL
jgi:hypothetical protein